MTYCLCRPQLSIKPNRNWQQSIRPRNTPHLLRRSSSSPIESLPAMQLLLLSHGVQVCMSVCWSVCLYVCWCVCPSGCWSVTVSLSASVCLLVCLLCLFVCHCLTLSICLLVYPSVCWSVTLTHCLPAGVSICLGVCICFIFLRSHCPLACPVPMLVF